MEIIFGENVFDVNEFIQYDWIKHAKTLRCECGHADYMIRDSYDVIGYADTNIGYMVIYECPKCFEKYRHHINTTGRYNLESFKNDLGLTLFMKNKI